jgi:eight-cysteine-cluster-containing protein
MTPTHFHRRGTALCAVAVLAASVAACGKPQPPPGGSATSPADDGGTVVTRQPAVPADHPLFDRFEGTGFRNDCDADADCHASGCSSEVCSADPGVITTCEALPVTLPQGTACGCVQSQCLWWNAEGATLPSVPPEPEPEPEPSCTTVLCQPPKVCLEYYGIAGPSGPKFVSCEIPCKPTAKKNECPEGMACVTIADGPGSVCR